MKNLVIIIHATAQQVLADQLRDLAEVEGFTFSHVEGHGIQVETDPLLSARDKVVGFVPRVRIDILLKDTDVDRVLKALHRDSHGSTSAAMFWVTDVQKYGRL